MDASSDGVIERRLSATERRKAPEVGTFAGARCELLRQLCYPFTPAAFLRHAWRQRCLVVHGPAERFGAIVHEQLHDLSLKDLLRDTPSEQISVWFSSSSGGGNESLKTEDAKEAEKCHRRGGSLYFRAPAQVAEMLVTALSQQVGLSFGALYPEGAPRSEVETFASKQGNITEWHFDFMENFTLQLSGRKTWWLKKSPVEVPLRGCTPQWGTSDPVLASAAEQQAKLHAQHSSDRGFHHAPPADFFSDATEVSVEAGDVLYVPAGTWHRVKCEEDSLSINISLMGLTWADLFMDALKQRVLTHASARAPVCMRSIAHGRRQLNELLQKVEQELVRLQPADILPQALALPRTMRVVLPGTLAEGIDPPTESSATNGARRPGLQRPVRRWSRFRRNSLAVLLLLGEGMGDADESDDSDSEGAAAEEEEEEEEEEMDDDDEEDASVAAVPREMRTRCSQQETLSSMGDLFVGGGKGEANYMRYVIHSHFGGDDLASLLRVELRTPPTVAPLLEWCRTAPNRFSARQAWRGAQSKGAPALPFELAAVALGALERHGFCRRVPKKGAPLTRSELREREWRGSLACDEEGRV